MSQWQIFLDRPKSRLDVTRRVDSRQPWATPVTALRSTTHVLDKRAVAEAAKAGTTEWSKRQRIKTEDQKFWNKQDNKCKRANWRAACGAPPPSHPDCSRSHIGGHSEKGKIQQPRTKMQKWSDKALAIRPTKIAGCAQFSSDEPLVDLMQTTELQYIRLPVDSIASDKSCSKLSTPQPCWPMRPQSAHPTLRVSNARPALATSWRDSSRRASSAAPDTAPQFHVPESSMISMYGVMTMPCSAYSQQQKPLLNPQVNPPKSNDAYADRARARKLQEAKATWRTAERLLSLSGGSAQIEKTLELAASSLKTVADASMATWDPDAPFVRSTSCSRFS